MSSSTSLENPVISESGSETKEGRKKKSSSASTEEGPTSRPSRSKSRAKIPRGSMSRQFVDIEAKAKGKTTRIPQPKVAAATLERTIVDSRSNPFTPVPTFPMGRQESPYPMDRGNIAGLSFQHTRRTPKKPPSDYSSPRYWPGKEDYIGQVPRQPQYFPSPPPRRSESLSGQQQESSSSGEDDRNQSPPPANLDEVAVYKQLLMVQSKLLQELVDKAEAEKGRKEEEVIIYGPTRLRIERFSPDGDKPFEEWFRDFDLEISRFNPTDRTLVDNLLYWIDPSCYQSWWSHLTPAEKEEPQVILSRLTDRYATLTPYNELYSQYENYLQLPGQTVQAYADEKFNLYLRAERAYRGRIDGEASEKFKMGFVGGLNYEVYKQINPYVEVYSFQKLLQMAIHAEQDARRLEAWKSHKKMAEPRNPNPTTKVNPRSSVPDKAAKKKSLHWEDLNDEQKKERMLLYKKQQASKEGPFAPCQGHRNAKDYDGHIFARCPTQHCRICGVKGHHVAICTHESAKKFL